MADVSHLFLYDCTVCNEMPIIWRDLGIGEQPMPRCLGVTANAKPLQKLYLKNVSGLDDVRELRQARELEINHCGSFDYDRFATHFSTTESLAITGATQYDYKQARWHSVTKLNLYCCIRVKLEQLASVFVRLEQIQFEHTHTSKQMSTQSQWLTVKHFKMVYSSLETGDDQLLNTRQARDVLDNFVPRAAIKLEHMQEPLEPGAEVVGLFDCEAENKCQLPFKKGDALTILENFPIKHWLLAKNRHGQEGLIPMLFVTKRESENHEGDGSDENLFFKEGEMLQITDSVHAPLWPPARNQLGEQGLVPGNYVSKRKEVHFERMPWYHGRLTRDDCKKKFSSTKTGTYLIRDSNNYPNDYTLCVRYLGGLFGDIEFYRIIVKDNKMTIDEEGYFSCLPRLVEHYEREADGLCARLQQHVSVQGQPRVTVDEAAFWEKDWTIEADNIELHDCITSLKYDGVFRGTYFGQSVMVKRPNQARQRETILLEAAVMTALQHPNVATFMGVILGNTIQLVTEYLSQGPLLQYITTKATEVTKEQQLKFARDICHGMIHLEEKGFLHRCLTATHVRVHEDGTAKLFNLWQARPVDSNQLQPAPMFAVEWAAPEVFQCGKFSTKSDMWSFGVVLWEIYTLGKEPYPLLEKGNKQVMLQHLEEGHRLQIPADCPQSVADIMKEAWAADPGDRPTFSVVLKRLATD